MELANIEKLIEKYLNAATSLQEEATLKNYFTQGDIAPHLQEYEALFIISRKTKQKFSRKPFSWTLKNAQIEKLSGFL